MKKLANRLERAYRSRLWTNGVGLAVLVNAVVLGAITEVPEDTRVEAWLSIADHLLLCIMVADVALCIAVKRRKVLTSGWDLFDTGVTLISVLPNLGMLSAFRVIRAIRVLRLISFIPRGRAMVDAMLLALRDMATAFVVLGVVFYSFVVIATSLFRDADPVHYGTLGRSTGHLYGIMVSLGSGLGDEAVLLDHLWALPLVAAFVIVASFGLMNMFIAVLVSALREELEKEALLEERARFDRLEQKLDALTALIAARGGSAETGAIPGDSPCGGMIGTERGGVDR